MLVSEASGKSLLPNIDTTESLGYKSLAMLVREVTLEAGLLSRNSAAVTLPTFGGSLELRFGESLFLIIVIINKSQHHPIALTE